MRELRNERQGLPGLEWVFGESFGGDQKRLESRYRVGLSA
jgi:hypothetical protein